jgi:hypothetical protein
MMAYTPTLVRRPAKTAVTATGAAGYESGSQKNSGKIAALMPNVTSSRTPRADCTPGGMSSRRPTRSAMFTVPVAA